MKYSIYAGHRYKKHFEQIPKSLVSLPPLQTISVDDATVVIDKNAGRFGVFDARYQFVSCSSQLRNKNAQIPPIYETAQEFNDIDAVYLGTLEDHFGHFLLEHTGRLHALFHDEYRSKKCVIVNNRQLPTVASFVTDFCVLLGIKPSDLIIVDTTTQFKRLYIPDMAFAIPNRTSPEFGQIFDAVAAAVPRGVRAKKVYVSRLRLPDRATFGEEQIQRIFENNGFRVIYPEQMSLTEQVKHMKNCRCLAGIAGSALHLSLFMPAGGTVIQLKRNKPIKDNADTQYALCASKECDFVLVDCALERLPTHHWSEFPQIIGPTKYLKQFLDDKGYSYQNLDLVSSSNAHKEYQRAFKRCGGFWYYQFKRMIVYTFPMFIPWRQYKINMRHWLNKHL